MTLAEQLLAQERPDFKQNKKKILEEIDAHGRQLLERMGLAERMDHYPHQLLPMRWHLPVMWQIS